MKEEKGFPKGERIWTAYYGKRGELLFLLTSKESREYYFLYEYTGTEYKRLGKSKTPPELEQRFHVRERMRGER